MPWDYFWIPAKIASEFRKNALNYTLNIRML